jgi:hypothetical protein
LPFYSIWDVFVLKWVAFQRILHHYNRGKEGRKEGAVESNQVLTRRMIESL